MKYIKLLWFDIRNGLIKNPLLFIAPIIIAIIACIDLNNRVAGLNSVNYFGGEFHASFADFMAYIYGGMDKYIPGPSNNFVFPVRWAILFLSISFIALNYPFKDIQTIGQHILIRTKGRTKWWLSKCGWNILITSVYHGLILFVALLFCVVTQSNISGEINKELLHIVFEMDKTSLIDSGTKIPFYTLFLPILISVSINLFQMTLSLFLKPMFSFFATALLLISSAYFTSPYLIGNYAMPVRYNFVITNGINVPLGAVISAILICAFVLIGVIRFHYYDILNRE